MGEETLIGLALIIMLGILAQWLAWRIKLASILLLLLFGILAGPVTDTIHADEIFGELLFPLVSLSVGLILFEGGLTLRFEDLRGHGRAMWNLVSIGAAITWAIGAVAAYVIFDLDVAMSLLLGAILVVTGPTVVGPLIRQIRPAARVSSILRWEGILIDPVGAILAVLVFEEIISSTPGSSGVIRSLFVTSIVGLAFGIAGANVLVELFRRQLVPEHLHNPFTLMAVFGLFTASDVLQAESGLLTVTVMGIAMANQNRFDIDHIIEFKEILQVLLISSLFIVLGSRLDLDSLTDLGIRPLIFVAVLMFIARPAAVFASTVGSGLTWREKVFVSWLAPRGIVAAAVASIFSLELVAHDHEGAEILIPVTFSVIILTVTVYSLTAGLLARYLNLIQQNPQGVLLIGAQSWARKIALHIQQAGFPVILADSNPVNARTARQMGLEAHSGNVLSERILEELQLSEIGHVLAMTPNSEVNSLAGVHFREHYDHIDTFQIAANATRTTHTGITTPVGGETLFDEDLGYEQLQTRFGSGDTIKAVRALDADAFYANLLDHMQPLCVVKHNSELHFWTAANPPTIADGDSVIGLVKLTELDSFPEEDIIPIEDVRQVVTTSAVDADAELDDE